jgi:tetratricopeptide (TPR) repeat protein
MTVASDPSASSPTEDLLETARAAEEAGDFDRALGHYRALGQAEPDESRWALDAVRVLGLAGREAESAQAFREALRRWPGSLAKPEFKALIPEGADSDASLRDALGANCPPDEALKRDLVVDDGSDVMIVRGGRPSAVIVFSGLADRMVMPLPIFDRYLAELGVSAIYLRDRKRMGYFQGVKSLGDYDESVVGLKKILAGLGADEVHTIGNSAGGIGAISLGIDLAAKYIVGFSAPTSITRAAADMDRRTVVFAERMLGSVPEARRDLRGRLMRRTDGGQTHLFYGSDMPEDRMHAQALTGIAGVKLYPLPGLAGHGALFRLAQTGDLRRVFANRFAG